MATVVKTTEEFSTRRKIRYGAGSGTNTAESIKSKPYSLTPSTVNATLTPHKNYYGKDQDGNAAYFIEFNVGDFQFDEITIRTEGHRLIVQGKSEGEENSDDLCREFTRDFTLPNNVDQYSIKAQLEETTRQLTLIGQIIEEQEKQPAYTSSTGASSTSSSTFNYNPSAKIGSVKENRSGTSVDYEIFLGQDLKEGQITLEIVGYNTLIVRVIKSDWDKNGDYSLELKRQIKLPAGSNSQNIEHGIDNRTASLVIKVPLK